MNRSTIVFFWFLVLLCLGSCGSSGDGNQTALEPLDTVRWGRADCSILKEGVTFRLTYEKEGQEPTQEDLTITNPEVHCSGCEAMGLTQVDLECYEVATGPVVTVGSIVVWARLTHPDGRSYRNWKGEVVKGIFEGQMDVGKADGTIDQYKCTGRAVR